MFIVYGFNSGGDNIQSLSLFFFKKPGSSCRTVSKNFYICFMNTSVPMIMTKWMRKASCLIPGPGVFSYKIK
jgi:hypothetical protein